MELKDILEQHHVYVQTDSPYQARARLMQALWRESKGLNPGTRDNHLFGCWLERTNAKDGLTNYLTETIRRVVQREIDEAGVKGKLYGTPRIYDNLLSSQPLCFNLFAELQQDLELATNAIRGMWPPARRVTGIEFEHSPGRGDERFTGDHSAFDVFVEYVSEENKKGFIAIEVKYHEDLAGKEDGHKPGYDKVATSMGVFRQDYLPKLKVRPLQQLWRDHLLAGSMLHPDVRQHDEGIFVVLYPRMNYHCRKACATYRECIMPDQQTFHEWIMEDFVEAVRRVGAGPWISEFEDRYLNFAKLESLGIGPMDSTPS